MAALYALENLVVNHQAVVRYVGWAGLRIDASSRVAEYGRILERARAGEDLPSSVLACVTREVSQLGNIVRELGHLADLPKHFELLLSGPFNPFDAREHDFARDKQFELLIASRIGERLELIDLAEPDVVAQFGRDRVALAAKRPKREKQVEKAVRKAFAQVSRHGLLGYAVIDLSMLAMPRDAVLELESMETLQDRIGGVLRRSVEKLLPMLDRRILRRASPKIGGTLLYLSAPILVHGAVRPAEIWALHGVDREGLPLANRILQVLGNGHKPIELVRR